MSWSPFYPSSFIFPSLDLFSTIIYFHFFPLPRPPLSLSCLNVILFLSIAVIFPLTLIITCNLALLLLDFLSYLFEYCVITTPLLSYVFIPYVILIVIIINKKLFTYKYCFFFIIFLSLTANTEI